MIILDYQDRRPIYEQIAEKFQMLIIKGALPPDTQLPSVRKLAMELSINPNTIQRAYTQLEQQGFIYPVKGRGNFVSPDLQAVQREKEMYYRDLEEVILKGKKMGIPQEELVNKIEVFYQEVGL